MKQGQIGDFFEVKGGKRLPKGTTFVEGKTEYPYLRVTDFRSNGLNTRNVKYIDKETRSKIERYTIRAGEVYISIAGTIGVTGIIPLEFDNANLTENAAKIIPKEGIEIDCQYLAYYLNSTGVQKIIESKTMAVGVPKLALFRIQEIPIKLPPLPDQKRIAAILDEADRLRQKDKQLIEKYNQLSQSVFLDMFGDPVKNPHNWERAILKDKIIGKPQNGFFAKSDQYVETGTPIIWISDFINKVYASTIGLKRVNASENEITKNSVGYGDVLFCRSSLTKEGIGKCAIIPESNGGLLLYECHIIKISLDIKEIVPEFFRFLTDTPFFRNQIMKNAKTSTMTTISQSGISEIDIITPTLDLQLQFRNIFTKIEEQKTKAEQSLAKSEALFNSLLQQAFKGEL